MCRRPGIRFCMCFFVLLASLLAVAPCLAEWPSSGPERVSQHRIPGANAPGDRDLSPTGPSSTRPAGIAVDAKGNVYVTGQGTTTAGDDSFFATLKYDSTGRQSWIRRYNPSGKGLNFPTGIAVDKRGYVSVTGASKSTGGGHDFATLKYDSQGTRQWTRRYNGPASGSDWPAGLAVDSSGNVYVAGDSQISDSQWDFTTIKYDSAGKKLWQKRYNGPYKGSSVPYGIAVDSSGSAYLTGSSQSGENSFDFATVKYDSSGKELWTRRHSKSVNSYSYPVGLAVTKSSVYVAGQTTNSSSHAEFATIKYSSNGSRSWVRYKSTTDDHRPGAVAADNAGNVTVTGTRTSIATGEDFYTISYDSAGKQRWVRIYNGPARSYDSARAIAVDSSGHIYITGESVGSGTGTDFATIKYGLDGKTIWTQRFNGKGNGTDLPEAIAVDSSGNAYVTGQTQLSGDSYGFATVKYDSSGKQSWVKYYSGW